MATFDDIRIDYTGSTAGSTSATSASSSITVNSVNDAPVGIPTITGVVTEDQVLTANTAGISDADGLGAYSYQSVSYTHLTLPTTPYV